MKNTKFAAIILAVGLILSIGCAVSQPASKAILATQPDRMDFSYTVGETKPPSQTINIKNAGGDGFAWRVGTNAQWMQVGPLNGTCQGNEVHDVIVSVRTTDVPVGTYSATIAIIAEGPLHFYDEVSIPVRYTVRSSELQPVLGTQPGSLSFTATAGGPNPPSQKIGISNTGPQGSQMQWMIGTNAQWMQVGPESGTSEGNQIEEVSVSVTTKGIPAGTYNANIIIVGQGAANSPVSIPVTYTVRSPSELQPVLGTQPGSLSFTATAGGPNPPSQKIGISNTGPQGSQMQWKVGTNAQWMQVGPESGTSEGREIEDVSVSVTTKGIPAGTYNANIIIVGQGAANSPVSIPVTYTVRSP